MTDELEKNISNISNINNTSNQTSAPPPPPSSSSTVHSWKNQGGKKGNINEKKEEAINAVKKHWKNKTGSDSGTIDGEGRETVLGENWQTELKTLTDETAIDTKCEQLKSLINVVKKEEADRKKQKNAITYQAKLAAPNQRQFRLKPGKFSIIESEIKISEKL